MNQECKLFESLYPQFPGVVRVTLVFLDLVLSPQK
jgi:hypothetical protein